MKDRKLNISDESNLLEACRMLFGENLDIDRRFLNYIQISGVKIAFKKKVFATHPDRENIIGKKYTLNNGEILRKVTDAYEKLNSYLKWRDKKNCIPQRTLSFNEFLYLTGSISKQNFINSLLWQKKTGHRIGDIAIRWKLTSEPLIRTLLGYRRHGELIGEVLLRHNIITLFQLKLLLRHQQKIQTPLGTFFINHGLLKKDEVEKNIKHFKEHNLKFKKINKETNTLYS